MPDRRSLLSATLAAAGAGIGLLPAAPAAARPQKNTQARNQVQAQTGSATPQAALEELWSGNRRWVSGDLKPRDPAELRRARVAGGQHPFAVVFSCIDSRVPPEIVFDQDLGGLFVVRTAGVALDPLVAGTVEYGPAHGTPLVMVLGHSRCGAIQATVESIEDGVTLPGNLPEVAEALSPAYHRARRDFPPGSTRQQRIEATVRAQVELTVHRLRQDPVLRPLIEQGSAAVTGGIYSLDTAAVTQIAQTTQTTQTTWTPAGRLLQATASRR